MSVATAYAVTHTAADGSNPREELIISATESGARDALRRMLTLGGTFPTSRVITQVENMGPFGVRHVPTS